MPTEFPCKRSRLERLKHTFQYVLLVARQFRTVVPVMSIVSARRALLYKVTQSALDTFDTFHTAILPNKGV